MSKRGSSGLGCIWKKVNFIRRIFSIEEEGHYNNDILVFLKGLGRYLTYLQYFFPVFVFLFTPISVPFFTSYVLLK